MIKVLQAGLQTSVQDIGRVGFRKFGVPKSGAMDAISASFANAILNNDKNDAVFRFNFNYSVLCGIIYVIIIEYH